VAVLEDGTARVLDIRTGQAVERTLEETLPDSDAPQAIIISAQFDPGGSRILTTAFTINADGQTSGVARLWDAGTGLLRPMNISHARSINTAGFSPDGSLVVTASDDSTARVWDTTTGLPLGAPLQHARPVAWAGFSPDGRRVLTASDDGTAQLWDARSGAGIGAGLWHEGPVTSAAFDADGSAIVTASGHRARTWDARTGVVVETRLRSEEGGAVTLAALSADGAYAATVEGLGSMASRAGLGQGSEQQHGVRVWDSATGQPIGGPLIHAAVVHSITFSPAGPTRLITAAADGTARIWDARTAAPVGNTLRHRGSVRGAAFNGDGTRVITASADGTARIWEASRDQPLTEFNHCDGGPCAQVNAAMFSPDDTQVVTGASDGNARLWNARSGELIATLPLRCEAMRTTEDPASAVTSVSFSPDGTRILTSSNHESLLWDVQTLRAISPCLIHEGALSPPLFGRDEPRNSFQIVTTSTIDPARVWDIQPEPVVRWELPRDSGVRAAAFSGDGRLVTGSGDGTTRIWNVRTGKEAGLTLYRDVQPAWTAFSGNGSRIVTLATDGVARIWDVPAGSPGDAPALARLAEIVAGHAFDDGAGVNSLERSRALAELRSRSSRQPPGESFTDTLAHWLFADPATRTISPVSRITVPEYVARLRREGESGEREAMRLFPWLPPGRR
jgi:WD40 repeat protein